MDVCGGYHKQMNTDETKVVLQKKMDTLSAKHLHELCLDPIRKRNYLIDALAIAVPILLLTARLLTTTYSWSKYIDGMADVLASLLLVLAALKVVYRWQEKAYTHSRLRDENISLGTQADALLRKGGQATSDSVEMFLLLVDRSERADREAVGNPRIGLKQQAYREALKEVDPGSTTTKCPHCNASPWVYKPGSCQVCGNMPVTT